MPDVDIQVIRKDTSGHLRVRPARPAPWNDYAFIYRTATCVRWDNATFELFINSDQPCSLFDEFARIRNAVFNEYGDSLIVNASTIYENLSHSVIVQIRDAASA